MKTKLVYVLATILLAPSLHPLNAAPPAWWSDDSAQTRILNANGQSANYAPLNIGQLKYTAKQAMTYFDLQLAAFGGSGSEIQTMVANFESSVGDDLGPNYAPANLGQLKAVALPFYNRLLQVGFATRLSLISHQKSADTPWGFTYPWNPGTAKSINYQPANIGQLKWVFSFDLTVGNFFASSAGDGIPDGWKTYYGLNPSTAYTGSNPDGDGFTYLEDYALGLNPTVNSYGNGTRTQAYTYDNASQVKTVTSQLSESFSYDEEGNLTDSH